MLEGSVIGAGEGSFVADDEGEALTGVGDVAENPGEAMVFMQVIVRAVDLVFVVDKLKLEQRGFDCGDAVEPPTGNRHGSDRVGFGDALRVEFVEVGVEEIFVLAGGFVGEDDRGGSESVAEGVLRRSALAFGGDGASGFGTVGSGGVGFVACHAGG